MPYLMQFADHSLVAVGWFPVLFSLVGKTGKKEREKKKKKTGSIRFSDQLQISTVKYAGVY